MTATDKSERIPVFVITGFLGSGKTTLINRLLKWPELRDTAIVVNEFGEIGIDHLIVSEGDEEIVLLDSGCLCCMATKGLKPTLEDLLFRRARGQIPYFRRIIVETSGLADPAPILSVLIGDYFLSRNFVLAGVLATVDGLLGEETLSRHPNAVRQAAFADRIVITKTDAASDERVAALKQMLPATNPLAAISSSDVEFAWFAGGGADRHNTATETATAAAPASPGPDQQIRSRPHHHDHRHFRSDVFLPGGPSTWPGYSAWVDGLRRLNGPDLLRIKGLIEIDQSGRPYVVQAVQHVVSPPRRLDAWPSEDTRPRIVAITCGISEQVLAEAFSCLEGRETQGQGRAMPAR